MNPQKLLSLAKRAATFSAAIFLVWVLFTAVVSPLFAQSSCVAAANANLDISGNHVVDFDDLLVLAQQYGQTAPNLSADFNHSGKVDFDDLLMLAQNYGKSLCAAELGQYSSAVYLDEIMNNFNQNGAVPLCPQSPPARIAIDGSWLTVGNGDPVSCTDAALDSALAKVNAANSSGGKIRFNCGAAVKTIYFGSTKVITKPLVMDGEDKIILSGNKTYRLFSMSGALDADLVFQNITLMEGKTPNCDMNQLQHYCSGSAILRWWNRPLNYSGTVGRTIILNSKITDNHVGDYDKVAADPDGGGAIYQQGGRLIVANSLFARNISPNGGAIATLQVVTSLFDNTFSMNSASGKGGTCVDTRPNCQAQGLMGGMGGAIYADNGYDPNLVPAFYDSSSGIYKIPNKYVMCRNQITDNKSGTNPGGMDGAGAMINLYGGQEALLIENQFLRNVGTWRGAALWMRAPNITFWGNTVANNTLSDSTLAVPAVYSRKSMQFEVSGDNTTTWKHMRGGILFGNNTIFKNQGRVDFEDGLWAHIVNNTFMNNEMGIGGLQMGKCTTNDSLADTCPYDGATNLPDPSYGLRFQNNILSQTSGNPVPCSDRTQARGPNLVMPASAVVTCLGTLIRQDPMMLDAVPVDHGGPTLTMLPNSQSPARNLGTACPVVDQRRVPRSPACDLGSVEF